jgi:hypothetical protein
VQHVNITLVIHFSSFLLLQIHRAKGRWARAHTQFFLPPVSDYNRCNKRNIFINIFFQEWTRKKTDRLPHNQNQVKCEMHFFILSSSFDDLRIHFLSLFEIFFLLWRVRRRIISFFTYELNEYYFIFLCGWMKSSNCTRNEENWREKEILKVLKG